MIDGFALGLAQEAGEGTGLAKVCCVLRTFDQQRRDLFNGAGKDVFPFRQRLRGAAAAAHLGTCDWIVRERRDPRVS